MIAISVKEKKTGRTVCLRGLLKIKRLRAIQQENRSSAADASPWSRSAVDGNRASEHAHATTKGRRETKKTSTEKRDRNDAKWRAGKMRSRTIRNLLSKPRGKKS